MIPVRVYAYIAIAAAIIGGLFWVDHRAYQRGEAHEHVKTLVAEANAQKAIAAAEKASRDIEAAQAESANQVAQSYERGKSDAQRSQTKLVADLNAGKRKLRDGWASCETNRLSDAVASASQPDAAASWRNSSAGRIIGGADQDAAQVKALQAFIIGEREAWNKQGVKR